MTERPVNRCTSCGLFEAEPGRWLPQMKGLRPIYPTVWRDATCPRCLAAGSVAPVTQQTVKHHDDNH